MIISLEGLLFDPRLHALVTLTQLDKRLEATGHNTAQSDQGCLLSWNCWILDHRSILAGDEYDQSSRFSCSDVLDPVTAVWAIEGSWSLVLRCGCAIKAPGGVVPR